MMDHVGRVLVDVHTFSPEFFASAGSQLAAEKEFLYTFSKIFDNAPNMPSLLQTVGLALLTILVPFAIAILSNFLRQGDKEKETAFLNLDLYVILQNVFVIRDLLLSNFLIFGPVLLWNIIPSARFFILLIWGVGVVWLTVMIYEVYQWRTVNDSKLRFLYLRKVRQLERMNLAWASVWAARNMDNRVERVYLGIFAEVITELINDAKYHEVALLLEVFTESLHERFNLSLLVGDHSFMRTVLEWHMWVRVHEEKVTQVLKEDTDLRLGFIEMRANIDTVLDVMTDNTIRAQHSMWYFKNIEAFDADHSDDAQYLEGLMAEIIPVFLESMRVTRTKYRQADLWEGFPVAWRVTQEGVADTSAVMPRIWLEGFMEWVVRKIHGSGSGAGENVEDVVRHLFPNVDPSLFLRALIVAHVLYGENKVRSLVETEWEFGFGHSIHPGTKKEQDVYFKNTVNFLQSLDAFSLHVTPVQIRGLRSELVKYTKKTLSPSQDVVVRKLGELFTTLGKYKKKTSRSKSV